MSTPLTPTNSNIWIGITISSLFLILMYNFPSPPEPQEPQISEVEAYCPEASYLERENDELLLALPQTWQFQTGDNPDWAGRAVEENGWSPIKLGIPWERQGYEGHDGYAWYRVSFEVKLADFEDKSLYLHLGTIDDINETFLNGRPIGKTGSFPPNPQGAHDRIRKYALNHDWLNEGTNVLSVRVYDIQWDGGMLGKHPGIYAKEVPIADLSLEGEWKFRTGDQPGWKAADLNDTNWDLIQVPAFWEHHLGIDHDGIAWYRTTFDLPPAMANEKMVLLMGRIDDMDQVFLNGELVGSTGDFQDHHEEFNGKEWMQQRGYYLSKDHLEPGKNVLAVRVKDLAGDGGIYEGPIGLISQKNYIKYWRKRRKRTQE
ncbi:MAG: beta galactosidase jelly roll domain-containing protein [Bacteroidota bacterium]